MDDADLTQERVEAHPAAFLTVPKSFNSLCIWCNDEAVVTGTAFCFISRDTAGFCISRPDFTNSGIKTSGYSSGKRL